MKSLSHPTNLYPSLVGSVGVGQAFPYSTYWEATYTFPSTLNWTKNLAASYTATTSVLAITFVYEPSHLTNDCPSTVGGVGAVASFPSSTSTVATTSPLALKVTVYFLISSHFAVNVILAVTASANVYSTSPLNQPKNLYPSLVKSWGLVAFSFSLTICASTVKSHPVSKITVYLTSSHLAVNVTSLVTASVNVYSTSPINQPKNLYPSLTGSAGLAALPFCLTDWESIFWSVPVSNLTVNLISSHLAVKVKFEVTGSSIVYSTSPLFHP